MIAIRLYQSGNAAGLPTTWPEEMAPDVKELPKGFDLLMADEKEYANYLEKHRPEYDAATPDRAAVAKRCRVSKDTIISRVVEMGALPAVMQAVAAQSDEDRFVFEHSAWFWSDNEKLRGVCASLKLDADTVLAADSFL